MVQTPRQSGRGHDKPIPPLETEKIWHGSSAPQNSYNCSIENWLHHCLVWQLLGLRPARHLQRVMRMAQYITGTKLPAIQDLYTRLCQRKALKIVKDSSHPSHRLFSLLQHGKWYRSVKSRLLNSFLSPSLKTPEHLVKWLTRLFVVPPHPLFTPLLLSVVIYAYSLSVTLPTCTITSTNRCPRKLTLHRYPPAYSLAIAILLLLFNYLLLLSLILICIF